MKKLITCILLLIIIASCKLNNSSRNKNISKQEIIPVDSVTVFITGNVMGSLKPCGCSGGQLGGLDRRPAVFDSIPADKRLLIDTGSIVKQQRLSQDQEILSLDEQDLIKFHIITQAFDYLNYDIVNFTRQDFMIARDNGLLDNHTFKIISSYGDEFDLAPGYKNQLSLDGEGINILTVCYDPQEQPLDFITRIFPEEQEPNNVNIVIVNAEANADFDKIIADISGLGVADCIICPINSDEPTLLDELNTKPLVCAIGRKGRYISSIVIEKYPDDSIKLNFNHVAVKEEIKQDQYLIDLYRTYQDMVKNANLLGTNPRYILDDGLKYEGSESCESSTCHSEPSKHSYEYAEWILSDHAKAYQTLVDVNSQYDPECIECHVIGYEWESGFKTLEKTPKLINVGCEICHGPGSEHNKDPYNNKTRPIEDIVKQCLECHKPEHSGDFAGHEEEKIKIIQHWEEPNDVNNVK